VSERNQTTIDNLYRLRTLLNLIKRNPQLLLPQRGTTRQRTTFGHPAPANLDLLHLTDPRVGIPHTLRQWVANIRHHRGWNTGHVFKDHNGDIMWLISQTAWTDEHHPNADLYHHDIHHAHRDLARYFAPDPVQSNQSGTAVPANRGATP